MILKSITLENYRSVEKVTIDINKLPDGSFTYGLIGVNEAGKSSILNGFNLTNFAIDDFTPKDYYDQFENISLQYHYELEKEEFIPFSEYVKKTEGHLLAKDNELRSVVFETSYGINDNDFANYIITPNYLINGEPFFFELNSELSNIFISKIHSTIFWAADTKYLITDAIDLTAFANNPSNVSIPLRNCFKLAGIKNIKNAIAKLTDSTERESLRDELGEKVTEHIKRVWPKHPIKITFDLSDGKIHFHVKDEGVKSKAKTADQRSDGFKQFISFLLTLSAENTNSELKNTIILLDEPETHLHPKAQEDLLKELVAITKANNNIVFFATHSNYMIDKSVLSRNYKVTKPKELTVIEQFSDKHSSYASVNYDVFEIASTDYHNELYGKAQELSGIDKGTDFDKKIQELIENCPIKKDYIPTKGNKYDCTLPTYIRHQIHHPENTKNRRFTESDLEKSIGYLLELITKINSAKLL